MNDDNTDDQTIAQYLQELLPNNYCVYNHGRAYYYSKQENNLLINHIEEGKKIDSGRRKFGAIIGDNVNTGINTSINAGTILGSHVRIGPNASVSGTYESQSIII